MNREYSDHVLICAWWAWGKTKVKTLFISSCLRLWILYNKHFLEYRNSVFYFIIWFITVERLEGSRQVPSGVCVNVHDTQWCGPTCRKSPDFGVTGGASELPRVVVLARFSSLNFLIPSLSKSSPPCSSHTELLTISWPVCPLSCLGLCISVCSARITLCPFSLKLCQAPFPG